MRRHQGIQRPGIGPDDIAHVRKILQAAFDFKGNDATLGQVFQPVHQVIIPQRKDGLVPQEHLARGVRKVVQRTARLDACSPVGTAAGQIFRQVAVPAVTHAQGSVDKEFQLAGDRLADGGHLLQRQLALQHQPRKALAFIKPGLLRGPDGALGRSMQRDAGTEIQHSQVLDDKGIGPGLFQRPEKLPGLVQFFLVQNGIEGYEHPGPEPVGIGTQPPDLLNRIARRLTRPEGRSCDIHGIGTAVNGCDADIRIPCRSKEFEFLHYLLRASIICLAWTPHLGSLTTFL